MGSRRWWFAKFIPFGLGGATLLPAIYPYRGWFYIAILAAALGINIANLTIGQGRPWSWDPRTHIPTYAGLARVITSLFLVIPYAGRQYEPVLFVPFGYLLYTATLCSFYDHPAYHYTSSRWIRILLDLVFSAVLFVTFRGLQNTTWVVFLVPITTLGRYYSGYLSYLAAMASWLFIAIATIRGDIGGYANFLQTSYQFGINGGILDGEAFIDFIRAPTNLKMWTTSKELAVVGAVFTVIVLIYREETRKRLRSVFDFGYALLLITGREGLSLGLRGSAAFQSMMVGDAPISGELLAFLCLQANSEMVVAVQRLPPNERSSSQPWVTAAFQTHGRTLESLEPLRWKDETLRGFEELMTELEKPKHRRAYCSPNLRRTMQLLGKPKQIGHVRSPESAILDAFGVNDFALLERTFEFSDFWVLSHPTASNWLSRIEEVFFDFKSRSRDGSIPRKIAKCRQRASLYKDFKVVATVIMQIPGWSLIFINNLPSNYRVVPRVFWDDGIEKLHLAQLILRG